MNTWYVVYTEQAENDLRGIFEYIALYLLAPGVAKTQSKRIMEAVSKLNELPFRHRLFENEPWHTRGIRVMPVDNYLVFYLPVEDKKTVVVIRIMYGGRDIDKQF